MKKISSLILIFIFLVLLLSGCNFFISDGDISLQKMEQLAQALDTDNVKALKSLFAINTIKDIYDFSDKANNLFQYYQGKSVSIKSYGLIVTDKNDYGKTSKVLDMSYVIDTEVTKYQIAVKWCVEDDFDKNNIGIHYIYIINSANNPYPEDVYWGDGTATEGIFSDKIYGGYYTDIFMEKVFEGNNTALKSLFRQDIANMAGFEDKIVQLFDRYQCKYDIANTFVRKYSTATEDGYEISSYYVEGFDIAEVTYKVCMRWCSNDINNQTGIVSLYITKVEGQIDMSNPYWADELWTEGINFDVQ